MAYDLTFTTPATYVPSPFGQALHASYGTATTPIPTTGVFTIDLRFSTTGTSEECLLYQAPPNGGTTPTVFLSSRGDGALGITFGGISAYLPGTVNDGAWHEVRMVSAGTLGVSVFLDGVPISTSPYPVTVLGGTTLEVGGIAGGRLLTGNIDTLRIYSIVRSVDAYIMATTEVDPASADLLALYTFDGNGLNSSVGVPTSTANDGTPGSLTLAGQVAFNYLGMFGASMISGTASTTTNFIPANGVFAVEAWAKTNRTTTGLAQVFGQTGAFSLGFVAGNASFSYGSGGTRQAFNSPGAYNDGAWHHLALSVGAGGGKFYVDGVLLGSAPASFSAAGGLTTNATYIRYADNAGEFIGEVDCPAIWAEDHYPAAFTPATSPYTPGTTNLAAVWQLNGNGNINTGPLTGTGGGTGGGGAPANIALTNPFLIFSPNTWRHGSGFAEAINAGAYLRFTLDGTGFNLPVEAAGLSASPYVRVIIDNGAPVDVRLAAGAISLPGASNLSAGLHDVEVILDGRGDYSAATWNRGQRLRLTGINVTGGNATVVAPRRAKRTKAGLLFGDSLTEQHQVNGVSLNTPANPNAGRFGASAWARTLAAALDMEWGQVGWGGMSWSQAGVGGVPAFPASWSYYSDGFSRLGAGGQFVDAVDYIWITFGANPTSTTPAQMVTTLEAIRAAAPTAAIFLVITFGRQNADLTSAAASAYQAAHPTDTQFHLLDLGTEVATGLTGGAASVYSEDGLHPTRERNGFLAGPLVSKSLAAIGASTTPTIPTGNLPVGRTLFKFVGTAAVNISNYPGLQVVWHLPDGGSWTSGKPAGPSFQPVKQFLPGHKYYVVNNSSAAIPVYGAQL